MKKIWFYKLMAVVGSVAVAFLLGELIYSIYAGFNPTRFSLTAYDRPVASFDPVRGYRMSPGPARVVRVERGHVIYDQDFRVNNMGWNSARDYVHKKPENTYRIVVLGDSFTSGEFLASPWPDLLNESLQASAPGRKFEVLSFGVDGGGLANWHSTYFGEIVPDFEFDAVIIASYVDNLSRKFTIVHADDQRVSFGRFSRAPETEEEFVSAYLPHMQPIASVIADAELDRILSDRMQWQWPGFGLATKYSMKAYRDLVRLRRYKEKVDALRLGDDAGLVDRKYLDDYYAPTGQMEKLWAILDHAATNDIAVMIAAIPDRRLAEGDAITGGKAPNFHDIELASVAKIYGAAYFNGYTVFRPFTPKELEEKYWFKYDAHWNSDGARLFAESIADTIARTWPPEN